MQKPSLIIIGAGASGLMAAHLLADKMQVTIVEAAKEIGGRIHTVKSGKRIIETGAEFIHGDLALTFSLLKEAGIKAKVVKGNMYRHRNGKFIEEEEMIEGWHKLMKEMKTLKKDIPLKAFLQKHFPEKKYKQLREGAISYAEGFDLADASKASVQALYNEWSHEDQNNYRIPTGYFSLLNYFLASAKKKGCILYTNTTVKKLNGKIILFLCFVTAIKNTARVNY